MKNLSKLSFLIIFLSLFISITIFDSHFAFAIEEAKQSEMTVLATVNIQDAKIVSQNENNFKLSFNISNREITQSGVKYGVRLIKESGKTQVLVDEKIYDESLILTENSTITKEVDYVAPATLSGDYKIILVGQNKNGFPFAFSEVGKVTLKSSAKGLEILVDSCKLVLNDNAKISPTTDFLNLKKEDKLKLTCSVSNESDKNIEAMPIVETRYNSSYGDMIPSIIQDETKISFKASLKHDFSIMVPIESLKSQVYNTQVYLKSGEEISNKVNLNYSIAGTWATISSVSLDKDSYKRGEVSNVSILSSIYSTEELATNENGETIIPTFSLIAKVLNGNGGKCGISETQSISLRDQKMRLDIPVKMKKNCINPQVVVSITDTNGIIVEEQTFSFAKTGVNPAPNKIIGIVVIILLLAILILFFYQRRKKNSSLADFNSPVPPSSTIGMLAFAIIISAYGLFSANTASADTLCYGMNGDCSKSYVTINLNKSSYSTGENVIVNATLVNRIYPTYSGHFVPTYGLLAYRIDSAVVNLSSVQTFSLFDGNISTVSIPAGAGDVSHSISFRGTQKCGSNSRIDSLDGACASPSASLVSEDTNSNYKTQHFKIYGSVMSGDVFSTTVFSHVVSTNVSSSDTISSVVDNIIASVNSTTVSQWKDTDPSSAPTLGTSSYAGGTLTGNKPEALLNRHDRTSGSYFDLKLDLGHNFAVNAYGSNYYDSWEYIASIDYTMRGDPTVDVQAYRTSNLSRPIYKNASNVTTEAIVSGTPIRLTWEAKNFSSNVICFLPPNNTPTTAGTPSGFIDLSTGPSITTTYSVTCTDN